MTTPLRVLLVEDSEDDAELVLRELGQHGHSPIFERVETAPSMRAALQKGTWDIVISDWTMPDFSARAALDVLKESGLDIPFIIVSGTVGEETAVEAMRAGAHDYVLKDKLARLTPAVERELRDRNLREATRVAEENERESEGRYRILERKRNAELSATLKEREVLLQEVQHRVKNNLQVISSLINMQMGRLGDNASRDALAECRGRVQAMALIHDRLYQSNDSTAVPFADYARRLATDVLHATRASPQDITLAIAFENISLAVDKAIPCGLLLNELITNALKHGFQEGQHGTISLELSRVGGGRIRLVVKDDGVGIPTGIDVRKSASLGMQLVFTLAKQLDGAIEVSTRDGTMFALTFPEGA
jgi:two-component sensor histidine kinase